jgi:hypothetical protein
LAPILSVRDLAKLSAVAAAHAGLEMRVASVDDPASLDRAIAGARAVINCAGPFLDTAAPVVEAALRARIPYLDMAAEQAAVLATFERYDEAARDAGVVNAAALAFYGGLSDLLATAAMGDWMAADEISVAVALDSLDALPKTPQLVDEIGSLLDKCFRAAIKQFDCAAKIFETRRDYMRPIIDLARVLEINADQFERSDHRIAIRDMVLALPLADCLSQWIICIHAANLSAAWGSVMGKSAARYSCR